MQAVILHICLLNCYSCSNYISHTMEIKHYIILLHSIDANFDGRISLSPLLMITVSEQQIKYNKI